MASNMDYQREANVKQGAQSCDSFLSREFPDIVCPSLIWISKTLHIVGMEEVEAIREIKYRRDDLTM